MNAAKWVEKHSATWSKAKENLTKQRTETNLLAYKSATRAIFKELLSQSFKVDQVTQDSYLSKMNELLDLVELNPESGVDESQTQLAEISLENLLFDGLISSELAKLDMVFTPGPPNNLYGQVLSGVSSQVDSYGLNIPVHYYMPMNNAEGESLPEIVDMHGKLYVNIQAVANLVAVEYLLAQQHYQDFDTFLKDGGEFSFSEYPQYLPAFMQALSFASKQTISEDKARYEVYGKSFFEDRLNVKTSLLVDSAYAFSIPANRNLDLIYKTGASSILMRDGVSEIIKEDKYLGEVYKRLSSECESQEEKSIMEHCAYRQLPLDFKDIKSSLYQLSKTDAPTDFCTEIAGIVFPYPSNYLKQEEMEGYPKSLVEVMMTKIFTEGLIDTEDNKISEKVDWDDLLQIDFFAQDRDAFVKEWKEYKADPGSVQDKNGLMQLRAAWFEFFDKNMSDFEKANTLRTSKKIQKAAKKGLDTYYLSQKERTRKSPKWQDYFRSESR